jgi:sarcosine oxidase subunit alpha
MIAAPPLVRPRPEAHEAVPIAFDGRELVAAAGDTVTTALLRNGIVATSRSLKFRRPRGPFCLQGDCGTCLVRIGGQPNLRACMHVVTPGLAIAAQNRVLPVGPDPTALVDTVFQHGIDHHHLMVRPRIANLVMQEIARNLAGLGTLPDAPPQRRAIHRVHHPDVVVIGGGRSGTAAAEHLVAAGLAVAWIDRHDRAGLRARTGVAPLAALAASTSAFGVYPGEGVVAAVSEELDGGELVHVVHTYAARHVVLATGAREPMIPLPNNDLPGVFAADGLRAALARGGDALARPAVVVGPPERARELADALEARAVATADVESIGGRSRVEHVVVRGERIDCDVVALAAPPAPASELARQAGARVRWNGEGFPIARDDAGRCARGSFGVWACGRAAGAPDAERERDGTRIAEAIVAELARGGAR